MDINDLTYAIRAGIFTVFKEIGPGLLESVYEAVLVEELKNRGLEVRSQVPVPVVYRGKKLDVGFRLDLLIDNRVIVEIKSVEALHNVHKKQVLTYLKLTGCKVGLLVNFNVSFLEDKTSLVRIIF